MTFEGAARRYERRHLLGRLASRGFTWIPLGFLLGVAAWYLSFARNLCPPWVVLPAAFVPSLLAMADLLFRRGDALETLSWLDRETHGRQELQAAWECRHDETTMARIVTRKGAALLKEFGDRAPRPHPSVKSSTLAVALGAVLLALAAVGGDLFAPTVPPMDLRGRELEEWAQTWAEDADGLGRMESRELADKMGSLGRRMADGSMGERQADQALKELQAEIEERRSDLLRETLAESLVDDLNVDRETAEMFRVQKRRLSADALAELGRAADGSASLSQMSREELERLLSDPDMRNRMGDGTPELTEELTEALKDALDSDDPRLQELEKAAERIRKARGDKAGNDEADQNIEKSPGAATKDDAGNQGGETVPGTEPGEQGSGQESQEPGRRTGGSGRGSEAVDDGDGTGGSLRRSSAEDPMNLPSETERSGSWRTVIRAYGKDNGAGSTPDEAVIADWKRDVESVIRREEIPPSTRDYVRDYFTALEDGPAAGEQEE